MVSLDPGSPALLSFIELDDLTCDSGLAGCSQKHQQLKESLSLSSLCGSGAGILFLNPGQAHGESHHGMWRKTSHPSGRG